MGNEGSLPSSDESEGMEYNPSTLSPSAVGGHSRSSNNNANNNDPRAMVSGNSIVDAGVIPVGVGVGGTQQHQGNSRSSGGGGERSNGSSGGGHHGGRLKGSVFTRRSHAHNQNSTGIERTNQQLQQQSPAESGASYPPSQSSVNSSSSGLSAYHTPIPSMAGEELAYINPGNITTQHPYQNTNNMNAHQQQQMYAQQQQQYQQQQQQQHYYNNNTVPINNNLSGATSSNTTTTTKKTIPGQRAGSAILKSMRNLNIGSAMHRIGGGGGSNARSPVTSPSRGSSKRQQQQQQQQQQNRQQQQQVNDWETRWDEDSEDDDDEDDQHNEVNNINQSKSHLSHNQQQQQQQNQHRSTTLPPTQHTSNTITNNHIHNNTLLRPELRPPEMDSGYTAAAAVAVTNINMTPTTQQQQLQHHLAYPPGQPTTITTKTATPDPPIQQQQQTQHVIDDDDDEVEWDTGIGVSDADIVASDGDGTDLDDTRPNVQQFLPLLRVLGKGSFGKVRLLTIIFYYNDCNSLLKNNNAMLLLFPALMYRF